MVEARTLPVKILLVEDNPADVRLLKELLKEVAIPTNLHAVARGEAALAFLRHEGEYAQAPQPDIIFLDLHLPGMNGVQFFAAIQNDPAWREIPVAVFSGAGREREQLAALGPVAAYFTKSLEPKQFVVLLEEIQRSK